MLLERGGILTRKFISFAKELIYKNIILDSDVKVNKSGMSSFLLHFQFEFLGLYILERFKKLITIINGTVVINKYSCYVIFIHSW